MLTRRDFDDEVTGAQIRAALGLLGWTQNDLAQVSNVALQTVRTFAAEERCPIRATREAMTRALESGGIRFALGGVVLTRRLD